MYEFLILANECVVLKLTLTIVLYIGGGIEQDGLLAMEHRGTRTCYLFVQTHSGRQ